jgi:hypothetical protein
MTEAEWLACVNPEKMLEFLEEHCDSVESDDRVGRKLRLFAVGCCRHVGYLLTNPSHHALEVTERYVDGFVTQDERVKAADAAGKATNEYEGVDDCRYQAATAAYRTLDDIVGNFTDVTEAVDYAACAVACPASLTPDRNDYDSRRYDEAKRAEQSHQASLLRDVFGNPFRPVTSLPEWRTSTVLALARQMYDTRDFSAMPILADALQDAGCDNDDVLNHCRGPGPHVRGCHVIDACLLKS